MTFPLELRPLRAILSRLAEMPPEAAVGDTITGWCKREGVVLPASTQARIAAHQLSEVFFARAPRAFA